MQEELGSEGKVESRVAFGDRGRWDPGDAEYLACCVNNMGCPVVRIRDGEAAVIAVLCNR